MDYLTPFDFAQLKAFFSALKQSNFNLKQIPSSVVLDGEKTPINKPHCLELLRSFPELSGEQFKDDTFLAKFLTKPDNVKRILSHLPVTEQNELTKIVETLPVAIGDDSTQTGGQQAPAEQVPPAGAGTGTMSMPGMPSTPSISFRPRRMIRKIPASGMEGGTGTGTAVTNKAAGLTAKEPKIAQRFNWRGFNTPNSFKNFGSAAGRFFKTNSTRIAGGFGEMAKGVGRGIVNPGLTGTYNLLGKAGTRGINVFARFSNQVPGRSTFARGSSKKIVWAFLGLLLLTGLLTAFAPSSPPGSTNPPIGPISGGGDISSCQFIRSDQNPPAANYNSPLLLNYIKEASGLTAIPASVLAAFIRVESPVTASYTDDQIQNYQCATSPTGALGIMQLQPAGTLGHDSAAVANGASLLNLDYNSLTRADYCDVRKNIIMGAGFILKKLSYSGYGNGREWDPAWTNNKQVIEKLVNGYYGCLNYPSCSSGPYSYSNDVFNSAQACQPLPPTPPPGGGSPPPSTGPLYCPIPNGVITCGTQSTPVNGCGHCGAGYPASSYNAFCVPYPATKWGMDVAGNDFQDILLPKIGGSLVTWTFQRQETGATEAIQVYTGLVTDNNGTLQSYYLQFHHTQPGSGNPNARQSGDIGGKICGNGCNERHVHIQIGDGGNGPGNTNWLDAAQYFCK